jgi:hypothetical protein
MPWDRQNSRVSRHSSTLLGVATSERDVMDPTTEEISFHFMKLGMVTGDCDIMSPTADCGD